MPSMMHANYSHASEQYRAMDIASRVESADPHRLVVILYEELLVCIDVLAAAARRGQALATNRHAHKARAILVSLQSGLDFDAGGELSAMLAAVYAAVAEELEARIADRNVDRIGELRSAVESVVLAWNKIV